MKTFKIIWILLAFCGLICIVTTAASWHKKAKNISMWNSAYNGLMEQLKNSKLPPIPQNVYRLQSDEKWMTGKLKEVWSLLKAKNLPEDDLSPLEFKEKLLSVELKLKQLANIQGGKIPDGLGFSEYTGGKIPEQDKVAQLNKQLIVLNEIIGIMLKNKITEVLSVKRLPYAYYSDDNVYKETVFEIKVRCVFERLLGVLADMPKTPFFAVVRNIKLNKIDENMVGADLVIGVAEFSK